MRFLAMILKEIGNVSNYLSEYKHIWYILSADKVGN